MISWIKRKWHLRLLRRSYVHSLDWTGRRYTRGDEKAAAQALVDLGAVGSLIEALEDQDNDYRVRQTAAEALGRLGDARAVEPLMKALDDNWCGEAASAALGRLGDPRAIEPLIVALAAGNSGAIIGLHSFLNMDWKGWIKGDHTEVLIRTLFSGVRPIRKAAGEVLAKLGETRWKDFFRGDAQDLERFRCSGDPRSFELLTLALAKDSSAATELAELGDPRAFDVLVKAVQSKCFGLCSAAIALGKLGDPRALEPLIMALTSYDNDSELAVAAVEGLKLLGDLRAVDPLILAFEDGKRVRLNSPAAEALGRLRDPRAVEPLIRALEARRGNGAQANAAWALGEIGDPRAVLPLIQLLGKHRASHEYVFGTVQDFVGKDAATALGRLHDPRATEPLIAVVGDLHHASEVRAAAAQALGELGDLRAVTPLIKALVTGDWDVLQAAAEALARLGESKWKGWIKGDGIDLECLRLSDEERALKLLAAFEEWDRRAGRRGPTTSRWLKAFEEWRKGWKKEGKGAVLQIDTGSGAAGSVPQIDTCSGDCLAHQPLGAPSGRRAHVQHPETPPRLPA